METILVIDDEAFMLDFVRRILEAAKYRVVTATNADAGLAAYRTEQPELVVTDLIMPDKDGIEMIRELLTFAPSAKILAISGGGQTKYTEALRAAVALGARASLKKPFQPNILLETVQRVLTASN
jgi:CheY-like chemotaxis protein